MWPKDEATGEVALKPIAQTFERVAPAALALTFSNGETIETTAEHPFYVQDRGFTPAGLVALGNSIVTRAGPSLQVTAIEKHSSPHKVYNFEVEDFHTYFVGESSLWVHNATYAPYLYEDAAGHGMGILSSNDGGVVIFVIKAFDKGTGTRALKPGSEMFADMIQHHGATARAIKGSWASGDELVTNIDKVNELTRNGENVHDAIRQTGTGRQAMSHGFTKYDPAETVLTGTPGNYSYVSPIFRKPE